LAGVISFAAVQLGGTPSPLFVFSNINKKKRKSNIKT